MKRLFTGLVPLAFVACADEGSSITGTYRVTQHTMSEMGCEDPQPVEDPTQCFSCAIEAPFFIVQQQQFFEQTVHTALGCADAAECQAAANGEDLDLSGLLFEFRKGDALVGETSASSYGGLSCNYTVARYTLSPTDAGVELIRTEYRLKSGTASAALEDDDCLDLTEDPPPSDELECFRRETLQGVEPE